MLLCRNAEGVHGQRNVGNPWFSIILCGHGRILVNFQLYNLPAYGSIVGEVLTARLINHSSHITQQLLSATFPSKIQ